MQLEPDEPEGHGTTGRDVMIALLVLAAIVVFCTTLEWAPL